MVKSIGDTPSFDIDQVKQHSEIKQMNQYLSPTDS